MCSISEIIASFAFVGLLICMALGLFHESRFAGYMEKHDPAAWRELGKRSKWLITEDDNSNYAGMQWYLILCGGYKEIDDPRARELGRQARIVSAIALACFIITGIYTVAVQDLPTLHCLVSWL